MEQKISIASSLRQPQRRHNSWDPRMTCCVLIYADGCCGSLLLGSLCALQESTATCTHVATAMRRSKARRTRLASCKVPTPGKNPTKRWALFILSLNHASAGFASIFPEFKRFADHTINYKFRPARGCPFLRFVVEKKRERLWVRRAPGDRVCFARTL